MSYLVAVDVVEVEHPRNVTFDLKSAKYWICWILKFFKFMWITRNVKPWFQTILKSKRMYAAMPATINQRGLPHAYHHDGCILIYIDIFHYRITFNVFLIRGKVTDKKECCWQCRVWIRRNNFNTITMYFPSSSKSHNLLMLRHFSHTLRPFGNHISELKKDT